MPGAVEPLMGFGVSSSPLAFVRATHRRRGTPTAARQFYQGYQWLRNSANGMEQRLLAGIRRE